MKTNSLRIIVSRIVWPALLGLMQQLPLSAQSYDGRPTCTPNGPCRANTAGFGYNDTNWRQWPLQPRPEEKNSKTVGAHVIPPPPPIPEQPLPHAEGLPAKPPISGESILPQPGLPGL